VRALRDALDAAVGAGVLTGVRKETFEEKLTEFEGVQFQAWSESIARLRNEEDAGRLLGELSLVPSNAARVAAEVVELADRMLTRTEAAVIAETEVDGGSAGALESAQRAIGDGLDTLITGLASLSAPEVAEATEVTG
jgi:hypothetical protein